MHQHSIILGEVFVESPYLLEPDVLSLFSESLSRHVQAVFSNDAGLLLVTSDSATKFWLAIQIHPRSQGSDVAYQPREPLP